MMQQPKPAVLQMSSGQSQEIQDGRIALLASIQRFYMGPHKSEYHV